MIPVVAPVLLPIGTRLSVIWKYYFSDLRIFQVIELRIAPMNGATMNNHT